MAAAVPLRCGAGCASLVSRASLSPPPRWTPGQTGTSRYHTANVGLLSARVRKRPRERVRSKGERPVEEGPPRKGTSMAELRGLCVHVGSSGARAHAHLLSLGCAGLVVKEDHLWSPASSPLPCAQPVRTCQFPLPRGTSMVGRAEPCVQVCRHVTVIPVEGDQHGGPSRALCPSVSARTEGDQRGGLSRALCPGVSARNCTPCRGGPLWWAEPSLVPRSPYRGGKQQTPSALPQVADCHGESSPHAGHL